MTERPASGGAQNTDPAAQLRRMLAAYRLSQAIHVAAVLGIADHVTDGPAEAAHLARLTGTDPDALARLLRGLAGSGIFAEIAPGKFATTRLAAFLQTDAPGSVRDLAVMLGREWLWRPWGSLLHAVRTGQRAFDTVFGMPFFAYLQRDPEARAVFGRAMLGAGTRAAVADSYDFSAFTRVVDVGGGQGALLADVLTRYPGTQGTLVEHSEMLQDAERTLRDAGVWERCTAVAEDFLESVPGGGDGYILSQILHDFGDEAAVRILRNCRRAMAPTGRVLVVERIADPGSPDGVTLADLNMMVLLGGRERSRDEYAALLGEAGLRVTRILPAGGDFSLVEAGADR